MPSSTNTVTTHQEVFTADIKLLISNWERQPDSQDYGVAQGGDDADGGVDGQEQGVAYRLRRSSQEFRKLPNGFEREKELDITPTHEGRECSIQIFSSIFDKISAKSRTGTKPRPKLKMKSIKISKQLKLKVSQSADGHGVLSLACQPANKKRSCSVDKGDVKRGRVG